MTLEQKSIEAAIRRDMMDLGLTVKHLRELKGLSQRELSAMSGITTSHICNIENAETTVNMVTLSKLFHSMGHTIQEAYVMLPPEIDDLDLY